MDQLFTFILNHWALCLSFVLLLALLFYLESSPQVAGMRLLTAQEAVNLMNREHAVVVDCRPEESFQEGHILNAKRFDLSDLPKQVNKIKKHKSKPVIVICANGHQSQKMGMALKKEGFETVYILKGGIQAWQSASLPLSKKSEN